MTLLLYEDYAFCLISSWLMLLKVCYLQLWQDVEKFSDIEKLYLYLKLPSGPSSSTDKSDQSALSSSRTQQTHAFSWIRNHLEEYPETSLPKQEVYDEYKSFCDNLNYHPLSAADFGKMMKNVFPNMKARRLGMRGKSKYCYSGLRKRPFVHLPSLPTLDLHKTGEGLQCDVLESPGHLSSIKEEVRFAACDLVCEWAQKVLKRQFDAVEDLARFLIDSHYISNKSLAALTIVTGTATEVKTPQSVSAFIPTAEVHSFQPHATTLSSPCVDAKQQLQRKIQRKQQQQEQKLHSPLSREGQAKRADDGGPCGSPTPPSPQPTIGIVVAAVPSPVTVQRCRQLMSPSPVGTAESKVLPINFQMVTQPVKQTPKIPQNILASPVGERAARQRYAQILPKPLATTAIALPSPSTMIIANSPIKTVMTTCHVSPVSLVKMTAISLAPSSSSSNTTASLTNTTLRPASAGISSTAVAEDVSSNQTTRSASAVPILAPVARPGQTTGTHGFDVEMEVEAIHKSSQTQNPSSLILTQGTMANRTGGAVQRAASVPIPQTTGFLGLEETSFTKRNGKSSSSTNPAAAVESSNTSTNNTSTLHLTPSIQNTSAVSSLNTSRAPSFGESSSVTSTKEGFLSTKSLRKRSGLSPELSPVKRVFMPQQPVGGAAGLGYGIRNTLCYVSRPGAPARPESAPATRDMEVKMNSVLSTQVHASSFRASGFYSVAKTRSSMQRKNTPTVMETSTSVSHALIQQQQGHTMANAYVIPNNPGLQKHSGLSDVRSSNSTTASLEGAQQQTYTQSHPATEPLEFLSQASSSSQLPMQTDMDYFPFDDDVTQDSIVEELVQMEEQMKLNNLQEFGDCVALQSQQAVVPDNMMSTNQTMTAFYHAANNSSNPIQTPTPTPTPTPTSEVLGGAQGLTGESPCSRITSTTPVDSALGSSRHTPVGTPHSSCSSTVPPSPVECRNPFAFTPINSSITGFHDGSTVSSSPVKPMQRPMATHPDKTRLEWMNNSYNSNSGILNKSNSGVGILPSYQGLIDDHFQKPHAFAVPHARHNDSSFGRLTPISPVQQQIASMTNMAKQEGFAVPAPLDNKTTNVPATNFRCRSVSPAVHQRNFSGNTGNSALPNILRSVVSPFNSPVTPEVLNIFASSQTNLGVSSMAQRSRSVPLNIMMQTEVLPTPGPHCNSKNITSVLLSKLDGDHDDAFRGLGINNVPSSYTARMNLTQILESDPNLSCTDNHLSLMTSNSTSTCKLQRPDYLIENAINEQMILSASNNQVQSASGEHQQAHSMLLSLNPQQQQEELQQHQQLDFSSTVKDLLTDNSLAAGSQLIEQVSELATGGADFPCEIRMTSELSSSINDLNALDTNLLFDPNQQQGQYQNAAPEELVNDPLFQQITSETAHSSGLDWLESKDHPTVGLMG
ncbi:DNA-binding protein RFX7-like isoform X2 [Xiphias gladius]|uniref:DNA-binding protein RFX7-like isoform X2 n=1 Tax=Xiphias gladius TaxID=8245 RepID=UPI001A99E0FB|nr:DNA-binding protein RFX7-like isoform X2 [Xiphias gladius]